MRIFRQQIVKILLIGSALPQTAMSEAITFLSETDEVAHFDINQDDRFLDVIERLQINLHNDSELTFKLSNSGVTIRAKKGSYRDYLSSVTSKEKEDLAFIIKTLAFDSLIGVGKQRSALNRAGDRIDHLHPFRFLITVFNDEELKAGIHAIRDRGHWIWKGFIDGITGSLAEEAARDNLLQFISDFSKKVKIDPLLIISDLEQRKWQDFVNTLIDKIPREIDPNRYNM